MKRSSCFLTLMSLAGLTFCFLMVSGCGGGSSTSSTSNPTSLTALPDMDDVVSDSSSSGSVNSPPSSLARLFAVSGTPTKLIEITSSAADTLFWNGLIAQIIAESVDVTSETVRGNFWKGEGACRMAQETGYALQNIQQAGTSICYMKNAPNASSGVSIVSPEGTEVSTLFNQIATTKTIQVQTSGEQEGGGPGANDIFIQVHGSGTSEGSAGYAVDLWFCNDGVTTAAGYQKIRVNNSAATLTSQNVETSFGTFVSEVSGSLTANSDGTFSFDTTKARTASNFFQGSQGGQTFSFKNNVSIEGDLLTNKSNSSYSGGDFTGGSKQKIISQFSGSSPADVRFLQAGFAMQWSDSQGTTDPIYGAVEFQDTRYVSVDSSTLLTAVDGFLFSSDSFYSSLEADSTLTNARSTYSCSAIPDIVVAMDMSSAGMQAVAATCEQNRFEDMNFCDDSTITAARNAVMGAEFQ